MPPVSSSTGAARARPRAERVPVRRVRLVLLGASGAGKSLAALSACGAAAAADPSAVEPTVGAEFLALRTGRQAADGGGEVRASVWDLSGHSAFWEVRSEVYRPGKSEAMGAVLVADASAGPAALRELDDLLQEAYRHGAPRGMPCVVLSNRRATGAAAPPAHAALEVRSWAAAKGFPLVEASAADAAAMRALFVDAAVRAAGGARDGPAPEGAAAPPPRQPQKKEPAAEGKPKGGGGGKPKQPREGGGYAGSRTYSYAKPRGGGEGGAGAGAGAGASEFEKMSIRQLKTLLRQMGVRSDDCLSRADLVNKLEALKFSQQQQRRRKQQARQQQQQKQQARAEAQRQQAAAAAASAEPASPKTQQRNRVADEVREWSRGKTIVEMLNHVHGSSIARTAPFADVQRAYKRALLKIHPDKHSTASVEGHLRATETFKVVSDAWSRYKSAAGR